MFKYLVSIFLILFLLSCTKKLIRPHLRILNKPNDTLYINDSLLIEIEVQNNNNSNLVISSTRQSCGCISQIDKLPLVIKHDETDTLYFMYKPFITQDSGNVEKSISFLSNSDTAISVITLKCHVKK
jgi:hypothetical protein